MKVHHHEDGDEEPEVVGGSEIKQVSCRNVLRNALFVSFCFGFVSMPVCMSSFFLLLCLVCDVV